MRKNRKSTLNDILNSSVDYLTQKNIENPRLNAELLLCHVLKLNRVDLYVNYKRSVTAEEIDQIETLLTRRAAHEPLQYVIGETEFMFVHLNVNKSVLIPRPETEILVEFIVDYVHTLDRNDVPSKILDIGTGSGNIAISLAKALPETRLSAIDISPEALDVALENAIMNGVANSIRFQEDDVLADDFGLIFPDKFDIVVSNPPYIREPDYQKLPDEIRLYEPQQALLAADNGLIYYKAIARSCDRLLRNRGLIACEIGSDQRDDVMRVFSSARLSSIRCLKDLAGNDRIVAGIKN